MDDKTKEILIKYKELINNELSAFIKLNADSAYWKLEYYKKHRSKEKILELYSAPQTFDLASYYAYGNAKDIVEEKFEEIVKKYESE